MCIYIYHRHHRHGKIHTQREQIFIMSMAMAMCDEEDTRRMDKIYVKKMMCGDL